VIASGPLTAVRHREKISPVQSDTAAEIARLRVSIVRAAAQTETTLSADADADALQTERTELCRQLNALRERAATAEHRNQDPVALRAELATLLSFATTLQADADRWLSARDAALKERDRQRAAARRERDRQAAERELRVQTRDVLQTRIVQTAARLVQREGGEWRRTLPVLTVDEGLTICSASVCCPRKGLRIPRHWLVTLNRSRDDVLIRPE
jgi:hypothetical protein